MASSNTPKPNKKTSKAEISKSEGQTKKYKPEKKKTITAEISKSECKTKKRRSINKDGNKSKKNKKAMLSNGNSKQPEPADEEFKLAFPINLIKTIVKREDPDLCVPKEALMAVNIAAEKFIEQFVHDAYACCAQDPNKCLSYDHLANVVSKHSRYDFLSDFVPERVKAEDALREAQQAKEDVRKSKAT